MTWNLRNDAREQACGRHLNAVLPRMREAMMNPRLAALEVENGRLLEKVRALTSVIDCLTDRLIAVEQQSKSD